MRKITILTIIGLLVSNCLFGQDSEKHLALLNEARQLYESKEFLKSGQKYSEAFDAIGNKGTLYDRYNAACSWALANQPDSSFVQLIKIVEIGKFTDLSQLTADPDLNSLHSDERWVKLIKIIEKAEAKLDKALIAILDTIFQEDQKYRVQAHEIEEKYGWESDEMKAHGKMITEKDSINLIKVKKIIDERGWLGPDIIGNQGNTTLFLVIQHSDRETQRKYLPKMRDAFTKGDAHAVHLALLEDRVAIGKGEKQIYGSQIGRDKETGEYYVLPLLDPDNVNKRRAEVGLDSIEDYISNWGITWNVEDYKKKLPEYEAKQKE